MNCDLCKNPVEPGKGLSFPCVCNPKKSTKFFHEGCLRHSIVTDKSSDFVSDSYQFDKNAVFNVRYPSCPICNYHYSMRPINEAQWKKDMEFSRFQVYLEGIMTFFVLFALYVALSTLVGYIVVAIIESCLSDYNLGPVHTSTWWFCILAGMAFLLAMYGIAECLNQCCGSSNPSIDAYDWWFFWDYRYSRSYYSSYPYYGPNQTVIIYGGSNDCTNCCCCFPSTNHHYYLHHSSDCCGPNSSNDCCCCLNCGNSNSRSSSRDEEDKAGTILCLVIIAILIVFAVIGLIFAIYRLSILLPQLYRRRLQMAYRRRQLEHMFLELRPPQPQTLVQGLDNDESFPPPYSSDSSKGTNGFSSHRYSSVTIDPRPPAENPFGGDDDYPLKEPSQRYGTFPNAFCPRISLFFSL